MAPKQKSRLDSVEFEEKFQAALDASAVAVNLIEMELAPVLEALFGAFKTDWYDGEVLDDVNDASIVLMDLPYRLVKARVARQAYGKWPPEGRPSPAT